MSAEKYEEILQEIQSLACVSLKGNKQYSLWALLNQEAYSCREGNLPGRNLSPCKKFEHARPLERIHELLGSLPVEGFQRLRQTVADLGWIEKVPELVFREMYEIANYSLLLRGAQSTTEMAYWRLILSIVGCVSSAHTGLAHPDDPLARMRELIASVPKNAKYATFHMRLDDFASDVLQEIQRLSWVENGRSISITGGYNYEWNNLNKATYEARGSGSCRNDFPTPANPLARILELMAFVPAEQVYQPIRQAVADLSARLETTPRITTQETPMPVEEKPSVTNRIKTTGKAVAQDSAWRILAAQIVRTASQSIAAGLHAKMKSNKPLQRQMLRMLESPYGEAALGAGLSVASLAFMPQSAKRDRLAHEFAVSAATLFGNDSINTFLDPFRTFVTDIVPAMMASLPEPELAPETLLKNEETVAAGE